MPDYMYLGVVIHTGCRMNLLVEKVYDGDITKISWKTPKLQQSRITWINTYKIAHDIGHPSVVQSFLNWTNKEANLWYVWVGDVHHTSSLYNILKDHSTVQMTQIMGKYKHKHKILWHSQSIQYINASGLGYIPLITDYTFLFKLLVNKVTKYIMECNGNKKQNTW